MTNEHEKHKGAMTMYGKITWVTAHAWNLIIYYADIAVGTILYLWCIWVIMQFHLSRAMGKCVFGVNLAILRFCDF